MKTTINKSKIIVLLLLVALISLSCNEKGNEKEPSTKEGEKTTASKTTQDYYDELDYQRAVQSYLWAVPAMYTYSLRESLKQTFGASPNDVPVWKDLMDAKTVMLTPNSQVVYAFNFLDLKKDGPTVLEAAPKMAAMLDDMWDQPLTDIGATGPDKGKGGKYLILPPGYEGDVPSGYFVVPSTTFGVMVVLRGYKQDGSTANAVSLIEQTKIYSLAQKDNPPKMNFINVSSKDVNTLFPTDEKLFDNLAKLVNEEPIAEKNAMMYGMLATIGIEKGKAFNPNERMQKILKKAAKTAHGIARSLMFSPRADNAWYYEGKHWTLPFLTPNARFEVDGRPLLDERTAFFFGAFGTSAGMVKSFVGKGSKYINTFTDNNGKFLEGENTYKLVMPANVPVKDFWSLTIYDAETRAMLKNGQKFPSMDSYEDFKKNEDGSIDLYFGPKAPAGLENNWVKTLEGKQWFPMMRFYGPEQPYFDKTWQMNDIELIK